METLEVLEIEAAFDPPQAPQRLIEQALDAWRQRRVKA